jgi:hypothetical protein
MQETGRQTLIAATITELNKWLQLGQELTIYVEQHVILRGRTWWSVSHCSPCVLDQCYSAVGAQLVRKASRSSVRYTLLFFVHFDASF